MKSIAFFLLAVAWTVSAAAHVASTGLATLDLDGEKLLYRLTVVATEVDDQGGRLLATAADGDRAAAERVAGFLRDYARFSIAGEACQPGRTAVRASTADDDKVFLEMALSCPKSTGTLAIKDDWPEVLGAHFQTVLSVRGPGRPSVELVFLEDRRTAALDLAAAPPTGWFAFIGMGVEHILGGIDHLLFLLALLVLARGLWQTVTIVTGFTLAHSITLSLAVLGVINVPSRVVEPLIAASVVWVAVENLLAPSGIGRRWLIAAGFGLVHGLGFATALTELDLSRDALVRTLVGFNVGVELAQIAFVIVVMPPLAWASRSGRLPRLPQILSIIVAAAGAIWLVQRLLAL
jgi:hydrogenase/urease accessory protein HupE